MKNNILHITPNIYPALNGKEHHTKNIWRELAKGFDEYHILARSQTNSYNYSTEGNIHLHLIPKITKRSKTYFFSSAFMFYLIKKYKINYLLSQCPIVGGVNAVLASKLFKIPVMVEIHGEEYFKFFENNSFIVPVMNFSFNNATKIRSLNELMTNRLIKYNINKDKIVEINNRVNTALFSPPKTNFKLSGVSIKLVSVGRFVWQKNYLNLIKYLSESSIDFHLTLIGGGPDKDKYLEYIKNNCLEDKITLIDSIPQQDLIDYIIKSDIYIQYSVSEGMPRAILEAMALRMPIISTDIGLIPGVLKDKTNSLLIKPNKKEDLLKAISLLMYDTELRKDIANQAYNEVLEKYEWKKVFEEYRNQIKGMKYENT